MRWLLPLVLLFPSIAVVAQEEPVVDEVEEVAPIDTANIEGTDEKASEEAGPSIEEEPSEPATWDRIRAPLPEDGDASVYIVPVHGAIGKTVKFIMRRALKEAIEKQVDVVVIDVDTPGGRVDIMLEIMEMMNRFEGRTMAYINNEAISAGALISVSADDIFFAPGSVIGSAGIIQGTGEDLPKTLKQKIEAYMDAKVRTMTSERPRRAQVLRAMMREDYVLELDGKVIKPAGELLTLTDQEAMELYGDPAEPLLGDGIFSDVESLMQDEYGEGGYTITTFEIKWSETLAQYLEMIAPILLGVGFLALVIEFYTPGFGFAGITGLALLAVVFLSNFVAGLAGYEPLLLFVLGFLLILIELLLIPGTLFAAITGAILMLGSLVWSLADIWPREGGGWDIDGSNVISALGQVMLGIVMAIVLFALLYRFLPRGWIWNKLVLQTAVGGAPGHEKITAPDAGHVGLPAIGARGVAVTNLRPSGTIEVDGRRYEATLSLGWATPGEKVVVIAYRNFDLLVDKRDT